jgi:hypothetical protein
MVEIAEMEEIEIGIEKVEIVETEMVKIEIEAVDLMATIVLGGGALDVVVDTELE